MLFSVDSGISKFGVEVLSQGYFHSFVQIQENAPVEGGKRGDDHNVFINSNWPERI